MTATLDLKRRAGAELVATAFLVMGVVGSGIVAEHLSPTDSGLALLENAIATGAILLALITVFGPLTGAHMNPLVTVAAAFSGRQPWSEAPAYIGAQFVGGTIGAVLANLMFGLPAISFSMHARSGTGIWLGEVMATFGLLLLIALLARSQTASRGSSPTARRTEP